MQIHFPTFDDKVRRRTSILAEFPEIVTKGNIPFWWWSYANIGQALRSLGQLSAGGLMFLLFFLQAIHSAPEYTLPGLLITSLFIASGWTIILDNLQAFAPWNGCSGRSVSFPLSVFFNDLG